MLKKDQRLRKTKEIEGVFAIGRSCYLGGLGMKVVINKLEVSRFTVLVSKKVSKRAVDRNKLKRRIREILKKDLENLIPCDIIVICQPQAIELELVDLKHNIKGILNKLKLYKI